MTSQKKDHKNMKKHLKNNPQAVTPSVAKSNPEPQPQENPRKDALSTHLLHYTVNTGDTRTSPRSEVGDAAIQCLQPIVEQGGAIPGPGELYLRVTRYQGGALFTIEQGELPIVHCGFAWTREAEQDLWPCIKQLYQDACPGSLTMATPIKPAQLPWLSVVLVPAIVAVRRELVSLLDDLERCIAWTLFEDQHWPVEKKYAAKPRLQTGELVSIEPPNGKTFALADQVILLPTQPTPEKLLAVRNPSRPAGDVHSWLRQDGNYRGNKPYGGLWTSAYTPNDPDGFRSDWERGLRINAAVQLGYPAAAADWPGWKLQVSGDARVLTITSLDEALAFTQHYHLASFARIKELQEGIGILATTLITNWERALADYDGVRLTAKACDEIVYAKLNGGVQTAFDTWNCESTLWGCWRFPLTTSVAPASAVQEIPPVPSTTPKIIQDLLRPMQKPK
jgi:hypothetical protein